jgi:uncharacterized repeat protein (TIGR02543 family)
MPSTTLSVGIGTLKINGTSVGWLKGDIIYHFSFESTELAVGQPLKVIAKAISQPRASLKATMAEVHNSASFLALPINSYLMPTYAVEYETFHIPGKVSIKIEFPSASINSTNIKTAETGYSMSDISIDAIGDMPTVTMTQVNADGTLGAVIGSSNGITTPPPTYTVTYNSGSGAGAPSDSNTYASGQTATILYSPAPSLEGYSFLGWSETQGATVPDFAPGGSSSIVMADANVTLYAVFQIIPTYAVTYNANGGSGTPTDTGVYHAGDSATVLFNVTPSRPGYNFLGWATSSTASSPNFTSSGASTLTVQHSNITLYAVYQLIPTYSVTYNVGAGSGTTSDNNMYTAGSTVTVQFGTPPSRPGYNFLGWSFASSDSSPAYASGGTTSFPMPTHNVVLYAIYQLIPTYTVSYSANGGVNVPSDTTAYVENASVSVLFTTLPSRTGYTFLGWSPVSTDTSPAYSQSGAETFSMPASNVVLYAIYRQNTYAVSYNVNGGANGPSDSNAYTLGQQVTVNFTTQPTYADHVFLGWSLVAGDSSPVYTSSGVNTFTMPSNDVTLYAIYARATYSVTYNANGGSGAPSDSGTYLSGATVSVNFAQQPIYSDHVFLGWSTNASDTSAAYTSAGTTTLSMPIGNVTLYAIYARATYSVTYDANGGTGMLPSDGTAYLSGATVSVNFSSPPSKAGYNFLGWATSSSAVAPSYSSGGTGTFNMPQSNVTLYAVYQLIPTYTITYSVNGGTGSVPTDGTAYTSGSTITVNFATLPSKAGYTFLGWDTNAAASSATYTAGTNTTFSMPSNNVTLYAIYQIIPTYTVTYNGNGGTGSVPVDGTAYTSGSTITVNFATLPSKAGYTFLGWDSSSSAVSPAFTSTGTNSFSMPTHNVTLYAIYQVIPTYTVTYNINGGTGSVPTDGTAYTSGSTVAVNFATLPSKTGYVFTGWDVSSSAGTPAYTASGTNSFTMPAHNITLYATYVAAYTITYHPNTGSGGTVPVDNTLHAQGSVVPLLFSPTPNYVGHTFLGWSTNKTATSPTYTASVSSTLVMPGSNVDLYAVYSTP